LLLFLLALAAGILSAGVAYQAIETYLDRLRFPAPGRLITVGPHRLHIHQQGAGTPAVILEAGVAGSSSGWALVEPGIAEFTRVASYDRAGLGWSDAIPAKPSVQQMLTELRALLSAANVPRPYVLVGHSFGGLLARAYAHSSPDEIAGLVLLDPVSIEYWARCSPREKARLALGARFSRRGALLAHLGVVRLALHAMLGGSRLLPKMINRASAGRGRSTVERLVGEVRKLPREKWPALASHWSRPQAFLAMAAYLEALQPCAESALDLKVPARIPLVILSAENATAAELAERQRWINESESGTHIRVAGSSHWVQLERPNAVISAIRDLVEAIRR
jgi:pimeloyl-ACP methyl ester carboxylesterase